MAIYTITLANEKTGEEISKRIFLFGDRPNFDTILRDMRELLIKRVTEKVTF